MAAALVPLDLEQFDGVGAVWFEQSGGIVSRQFGVVFGDASVVEPCAQVRVLSGAPVDARQAPSSGRFPPGQSPPDSHMVGSSHHNQEPIGRSVVKSLGRFPISASDRLQPFRCSREVCSKLTW